MPDLEKKRINDVLSDYAKRGVKLNVRKLGDDDADDDPAILIEGDADALRFLGELLIAHSFESDDGFGLSPHGAGSTFFTRNSTKGFYIHRLPCSASPINGNEQRD